MSTTLPGSIGLSLAESDTPSALPAGSPVQAMQARWSDALGQLILPAIPAHGGDSVTAPLAISGVAPLIAGAPRAGAAARLNVRPVVTGSRTVPASGGDPVGLALFAGVAAAVVAGLSRRRSRAR